MDSRSQKAHGFSAARGARRVSRLASALLLAAFATGALFAQEEQVLNLEGMSVIGNRELPKSLVIVPWKKALPGEVSAPVESLLDGQSRVACRIQIGNSFQFGLRGFRLVIAALT